jgi:hypothetical protein
MDNLLVMLVARLISIHCEFGPAAYTRAVYAAYGALGRIALDEAESQAGTVKLAPAAAEVVKFPLARRRGHPNQESDRHDNA